jgi:hypothetical protein
MPDSRYPIIWFIAENDGNSFVTTIILQTMRLQEVRTEEDKRLFRELAVGIYRGDPNWIRPLDKDIEEVFDPAKNKLFKEGKCRRWILWGTEDKAIGRIAAFVNSKYSAEQEQATGGVGFFECIDDKAAAHFMFDHCRQWLKDQGMEAMDGPINFGEKERWWGLQVEGYQEPLYCMNYNPPYYRDLFESYGFEVYYRQLCYSLEVRNRLQDKFFDQHDEISKNPDYKARQVEKSRIEKFAKDFAYIYNKAWAGRDEKGLEEKTVLKMFKAMLPVIDEHIMWFAYHKNEPVAMWVNLPDLNQYFRHLQGKFGLWEKLKFLWLKKFGKCDRFVGLVFGVIPEFQGKGVDAYLIVEGAKVIQQRYKYERYEIQWVGDFNPKMVHIAESLGTHLSRVLCTYRFLFDRKKEFKRREVLSSGE